MKSRFSTACPLRCLAGLMLAFCSLALSPPAAAQGYGDGYDRPSYYPDWTQPSDWLNVMYYFTKARLGADGEPLTNYEVLVYDQQDRLRHCSRSRAVDHDLCTLTIPGEMGDTFHFKIVYGPVDDPIVVDAEETCSFEDNALQGSLSSPFWLTVAGYWQGDLNEDDEVSIVDITRLVGTLRGQIPSTPRSDVNGDGRLNLSDVSTLREIILGLTEKKFVCGK